MSGDLVRAIAPGAGMGLTLALMFAFMAMRQDRAQVKDGKKVLAYGIGFKVLAAIVVVAMASVFVTPFAVIARDPSRLTSQVLSFIGLTLFCWGLASIAGLLPTEIFFKRLAMIATAFI